jgi:transposase
MRALLFMAYIKGEAVTQGSLFPVALDELIPADHLVQVVAAYVDGLALDALGFSKAVAKSTGRPPYDPADMLKLYLYGYLHRVRSSRRLEAECQRNVEVMWLLGRLTPDFKTIAEFRRLNGKAFAAVCRSFVQFCRRAGLMAGELVAIDGSKFQAAASRKQYTSATRLAQQQAALDKQIAAYLAQLDHGDKEEAGIAIDRSAVQAALQQLQQQRESVADQQDFLQQQGLSQYVQTEPDARMMRYAHGKMVAYNVQTAVDAQHGLIVHHEVTQDASDNRQLLPVAVATKAVLQQETLTAVADAGYSNGEQFQACEDQQIEAFVPANRAVNNQSSQQHFQKEAFTYCADSDSWRCPNHCTLTRKQMNKGSVIYAADAHDCATCPLKSQCTDASQRFISRHAHEEAFARMATRLAENPEMMRWRRQTVEHPFGNIKQWIMGNGRFLLWGLQGASTEMALAVTAYNLKRTINVLGTARMLALLA